MWKKLGWTRSSWLVLPFSPKPAGPGSPRGPICPSRPLWPVGPSGPDSPVSKEVQQNQQSALWYCSLSLHGHHRKSEGHRLNSTCTSLWSPWSIHSWVTHQARSTLTHEVWLDKQQWTCPTLVYTGHSFITLFLPLVLPGSPGKPPSPAKGQSPHHDAWITLMQVLLHNHYVQIHTHLLVQEAPDHLEGNSHSHVRHCAIVSLLIHFKCS